MTLAGSYFFLGLLSALCTASALVQARRVYWLAPVYFLAGWLAGELALVHLLWQLALTAVMALFGAIEGPWAQAGLALFCASWLGLVAVHVQAMDTPRVLRRALRHGLGEDYRRELTEERRALLRDHVRAGSWLRPFAFRRAGVALHADIAYGDAGKRNLLDIYQPERPREGGFPVLLQVHGGGWTIGNKYEQGKPLMYHMAQRGWVCVAINYRLSPRATFPDHIVDVKKAIHWIREHIAEYGGNPDFIAITGGSAGGHLSALAALTPNLAEFQPGFSAADTNLQAAVPFYGVYDLLDRDGIRPEMSMEGFLAGRVLKCTPRENPTLWQLGSPLSHVSEAAPPMMVVQGTHDTLVWVEEARHFVGALRAESAQPVVYAELPGAQHAFDFFHSLRTDHTVNAVADFLECCHARWVQGCA